MAEEKEPQGKDEQPGFKETLKARPLTHGEFYLAMTERPDPNGVGLRPELRSFFVGQERAYRQLSDVLTQSPSGTVVVLSAPFGAGKNTLVDVVANDLITGGRLKEHDIQWVNVYFDLKEGQSLEDTKRRFYGGRPDSWKEIKPQALCVNEVAYGWSFNDKESLQKQLAIAGKFLGKEVPIMVLLGDYALEDPEIVGAVGSPYEPIIIKFDPLTPDMLKETLRQRLAYALERAPEEIDVDSMLDSAFLTALIPNTEYPTADMRGALVHLQKIGRQLRPTEVPLKISGDLVGELYSQEWYDDFWRASDQKQQFMLWIMQHINNHSNGKDVMKAMSIADMMQACPLGIDEPERVAHELASSVKGLRKVSSSPDLYLPRQDMFLMAALRQMPLDPYSKEGQVEVKRIEELVDKGTYKQEDVNINAWNPVWDPLVEKMRLIYGWNSNFSRYIVVGALSSLEERRKAKKESEERRMHGP